MLVLFANPQINQSHAFISLNLFKLNSFGPLLRLPNQVKLDHISKKYPLTLFFRLNITIHHFLQLIDFLNNPSKGIAFSFKLFIHF